MTCRCTVCQCGRHRCAPTPSNICFQNNPECPRSTYNGEFTGRPTDSRQAFRPMGNLKPSEDRFDGVTCNQLNYVSHQMPERRYSRPPEEFKPSTMPLQDLTTHQDAFRNWDTTRKEEAPHQSYNPPSSTLKGRTNYKEDFQPRPPENRKPFKTFNNLKASGGSFDDATSNPTYVARHPEGRSQRKPPEVYKRFKTYNNLKASGGSFDDPDFQPPPYVPQQPLPPRNARPPDEYKPSTVPLQELTTHKDAFRNWETTRKFQPDTEPKPMEFHKPVKTFNNLKASGGSFNDATSNPTYVSVQPEQRYVRTPEVYKASTVPLQGTTSYSHDYSIKEMKPNVSYRPVHQCPAMCDRMEGDTTYSTTYTEHGVNVCPAAASDPPPGYMYDGGESKGHKFLRKL